VLDRFDRRAADSIVLPWRRPECLGLSRRTGGSSQQSVNIQRPVQSALPVPLAKSGHLIAKPRGIRIRIDVDDPIAHG